MKRAGGNVWRTHKLIGPAAAEKGALAVACDVDVENTREGARAALHTANVHAGFSECIEQKVAKTGLAHAPEQANVGPPATPAQGPCCPKAAGRGAGVHRDCARIAAAAESANRSRDGSCGAGGGSDTGHGRCLEWATCCWALLGTDRISFGGGKRSKSKPRRFGCGPCAWRAGCNDGCGNDHRRGDGGNTRLRYGWNWRRASRWRKFYGYFRRPDGTRAHPRGRGLCGREGDP